MEWSTDIYLRKPVRFERKKILLALGKKAKSFMKEQKSGWHQVPQQHRKAAKKFLKTQGKEM